VSEPESPRQAKFRTPPVRGVGGRLYNNFLYMGGRLGGRTLTLTLTPFPPPDCVINVIRSQLGGKIKQNHN